MMIFLVRALSSSQSDVVFIPISEKIGKKDFLKKTLKKTALNDKKSQFRHK